MNHWVLDGYNVMHALNFIKDDLLFEVAREQFISWVCPFQALGDKHVTIVFDDNVHAPGPNEIHSRIRVIYSPTGFNADGTILSIIRQLQHSQRRYLVAVTRDMMLKEAIISYGCMVVSPKHFADEFRAYRVHSDFKSKDTKSNKPFSYQPFKEFFK